MQRTVCYFPFPGAYPTGSFCALPSAHDSPCVFVDEDDLDEHRVAVRKAS